MLTGKKVVEDPGKEDKKRGDLKKEKDN